jgi:hypothetical protein
MTDWQLTMLLGCAGASAGSLILISIRAQRTAQLLEEIRDLLAKGPGPR